MLKLAILLPEAFTRDAEAQAKKQDDEAKYAHRNRRTRHVDIFDH